MSDEREAVVGDMTAGAMTRREERAQNDLGQHLESTAIEADRMAKMTRYTAARDRMNELLGRTQALLTVSKFTEMGTLVALREIKEKRLYQEFSGSPRESVKTGELLTVSTWPEFCEHCLNKSSQHLDEQIRNLNDFGIDALESMQRIGLGYREMRKLRQLPDDDRAEVLGEIEINVGDKQAIVELIESQAAKHAREKAEIEGRVDQLHAELDASRKVTAEKNAKIDELSERLHLSESMKPDERADELYRKLQEATRTALAALTAPIGVFTLIDEWGDAPRYLLDARGLCLATISHELIELQSRFNIPDVKFGRDDLSWVDEAGGQRPPVAVSDCLRPGSEPAPSAAGARNTVEHRFDQEGATGENQP